MWTIEFSGIVRQPGHYLLVSVSRGRHDIDLAIAANGEAVVADTYEDCGWLVAAHQACSRRMSSRLC
jgi:hypothetical protein